MAKQIKDEKVDELINMVKSFDFSYLINDDLEKWKQGVNKEYLVKKLLHEVLEKYGTDSWKRLLKVLLESVTPMLNHDIEIVTLHKWFMPYDRPKENDKNISSYKLHNHSSLKHGDTNRMS